jgi:hypothetical protein
LLIRVAAAARGGDRDAGGLKFREHFARKRGLLVFA